MLWKNRFGDTEKNLFTLAGVNNYVNKYRKVVVISRDWNFISANFNLGDDEAVNIEIK